MVCYEKRFFAVLPKIAVAEILGVMLFGSECHRH